MEKDNLTTHLVLNLSKDTLLYIPSKLLPALFSFLSLSIYTRIFSPQEYGDYSLIMVTFGILEIFACSWVNYSNLRFFTPYKIEGKLGSFFTTSFFSLIGTSIIISLALIIIPHFFVLPFDLKSYIPFLVGMIITTSFFETIVTILRSDRKPKLVSLFRSLVSVLSLSFSLLIIYFLNARVDAILLGVILSNFILSIFLIFKADIRKHIKFQSFSIPVLKEFLSYGMPLITTLLFSWILSLSDRYIIEYFRSAYEVGIYSAVYQLIDYPMSLITALIIIPAFPIIIDTWEKSGDEITQTFISKIVQYHLILTVPVLFGIVILAKDLINILGDKYLSGVIIIPLIAIGSFAMGLKNYYENGIELKKKTNYLAVVMVTAGLTNIALNFVFVPRYGFYGAAISTTLSNILYMILLRHISSKCLSWDFPRKTLINCTIASLFMTSIVLLFKHIILTQYSILNLLLLSAIGCVSYFLFICLIGELKNEVLYIIHHFQNYVP